MLQRCRLFALLVLLAVMAAAITRAEDATNLTVQPRLTLINPKAVDQDDMCIWVYAEDPARSTIITSDKSAGHLFVYDLHGAVVQTIEKVGKPGNIDIRDGFLLGGKSVSIVGLNERNSLMIQLYAVDSETRQMRRIDDGAIKTGMNYGFTLYHSAKTGEFFAFTVPNDTGGEVEQYRLSANENGTVSGSRVRSWPITESEGCATDDRTGMLYISEEKVGIWRVGAEPDAPVPGTLVQPVETHGLTADVEGLTVLHSPDSKGYLLASSQGNSRYNVYQLDESCTFVKSFAVEGATDTDGIDVCPANFGAAFPGGIFTMHNGAKAPYPVQVCDLRDLDLPLE